MNYSSDPEEESQDDVYEDIRQGPLHQHDRYWWKEDGYNDKENIFRRNGSHDST